MFAIDYIGCILKRNKSMLFLAFLGALGCTDTEPDKTTPLVESAPGGQSEEVVVDLFELPENPDFTDRVIDLIVEERDGGPVEFPEIYDSLSTDCYIPDSLEKLIIAEKLKSQGFEVVNWGRGNFPKGPRIVTLDLQKEGCKCIVSKKYYTTDFDSAWEMTETIRCELADN